MKNVDLPAIDGIVPVTNDKFAYQFEEWVETASYDIKLTVVNDGTLSNDTRLGAIGDIQFVIEQENITDDLMMLAGDNLFELSLADFAKFAKEKDIDAIAIY